jgi:hypothetical protein
VWPRKLKMSGSKRKECSSPEVIESEEEEQRSPVVYRRMHSDHEPSKGRFRTNSDGERFDNDDRDARRARPGPRWPPLGGYRPYPRDTRAGTNWEGRYSLGFYHPHSSSSSRGPFRLSRSPKPYSRAGDRGGWWGEPEKD